MPSPFPGMNPYLEHASIWHDFHKSFLPLAADALGKQVLPRYFVKIVEHLYANELPEECSSESYLEILDRETRQLVTVVELLSPSNKQTGSYREQYVSKVRQLMFARVNVVEIDLLRGGPRMPWKGMQACDYCVVVSRAEEEPKAGLWPIRLRDRLPEIPVPLRLGVADARLDLQQLLNRINDSAGYGYYIYDKSPETALSPSDAEWAHSFVPAATGQ